MKLQPHFHRLFLHEQSPFIYKQNLSRFSSRLYLHQQQQQQQLYIIHFALILYFLRFILL